MNVELHLLVNGVDKGPLPSYQSLNLSPVFCDVGGLAFKYPRNGKRFALLKGKDELEIVPWIDGVAQPRLGGYVNQLNGDDTAEVGMVDYSGQTYLRRLDEIRVYPLNWPSFDPKAPSWQFTNANAGVILKGLLNAAQGRGTATDITHASFSTTVDSNGVAWAKTITLEVKPGATLLDVVRSLYENNMVEFEMVGRDLRVYNIDTLSVDRTIGPGKPLTFRKGRDLRDSPRKINSRDIATVMLGAGKEDKGIYKEEVNPTAIANRRRIEGFVSNGNLIEIGGLEAFTEARLEQAVNPTMEKTHGLALSNKKTPKPLADFNVGDWAYSDTGDGLEKLRVKAWVVSVDDKGMVSGSVTLNDLIAEQNARLTKRIDGIIGGSTITGESKAIDAVPTDVIDGVAPGTPTGLAVGSAPFFDDDGTLWAAVTATWSQVTANTDGTVIEDLAGYTVAWRYTSPSTGPWHIVDSPGTGTTVTWSPVGANANIDVRVQAYDKMNNRGGWSTIASHTTQSDATPPEQPSAPVMDTYLGLLRAKWDGKTASGAAWAPDFMQIQVHVSTVNNFTPTAATWVDTLTDAGLSYVETPYGTVTYVKFVAVDRSGNLSPASVQGSGTSSQIVSNDVFDGAIGTAKLADLAVTTAKIGLLQVNNAQMGSVSIAKLTAGLLTVDMTIGARIATALTGQRSEMNATGFQSWDASGNLTVSITGVTNLMMGIFKTALVGRRIEIGASGQVGEVNFYGPQGQLGQVRGFTADNTDWNTEAISLRYPIASTAGNWNQISVGSNEQAFINTGFIGMYVGGDGTGIKGFQINWVDSRNISSGINGAGVPRFQISSTATSITDPGGSIIAQFANTGGTDYWTRLRARSTAGTFGGTVDILFYRSDTSPALRMFAPNMVAAGHFFFDSTSQWFSFVNGAANAFIDARGNSFIATSDETAKRAIRKLGGSAREKLAGAEAHTYQMRGKGLSKRRRVGFMVADMPEEIRVAPAKEDPIKHEGVDLYGLTTLSVQYAKEIDSDLAELREEIAALRELVAAK